MAEIKLTPQIPSWLYALISVAFIILLAFLFITGKQLSLNPLGFIDPMNTSVRLERESSRHAEDTSDRLNDNFRKCARTKLDSLRRTVANNLSEAHENFEEMLRRAEMFASMSKEDLESSIVNTHKSIDNIHTKITSEIDDIEKRIEFPNEFCGN